MIKEGAPGPQREGLVRTRKESDQVRGGHVRTWNESNRMRRTHPRRPQRNLSGHLHTSHTSRRTSPARVSTAPRSSTTPSRSQIAPCRTPSDTSTVHRTISVLKDNTRRGGITAVHGQECKQPSETHELGTTRLQREEHVKTQATE